jgi:hypothetical protein
MLKKHLCTGGVALIATKRCVASKCELNSYIRLTTAGERDDYAMLCFIYYIIIYYVIKYIF